MRGLSLKFSLLLAILAFSLTYCEKTEDLDENINSTMTRSEVGKDDNI